MDISLIHRNRVSALIIPGHVREGAYFALLIFALLAAGGSVEAGESVEAKESTAEDTFFYEHVVPIFQRRCIGCHSDSDPSGEFSVQSAQGAFESGFIEAGDPASRLLEVISPVDGKAEMPKDADPMTAEEMAIVRKWVVEQGARWPKDAAVAAATVEDFNWWSLRPLQKPELPNSNIVEQAPHVIDQFIQSKLTDLGIAPNPEADRRTLVRRLYFDLIGLPPTPTQVSAFVHDDSATAYEDLVDRLLASKHYGERWARHWLDVVHYADTHGYDKDKMRPNAWPYRDYVIRSFNEDKPYGRFVREQLAGDVLWPDSRDGITATGFIAAGPWDFIGHAEVPESKIDGRIARHLDRDDMVSTTATTFLSTTVHCARCHNHKFDPISQEHYYSLQTVFAALDRADRSFDSDPTVARQRKNLIERQRSLEKMQADVRLRIGKLGGKRLATLDEEIERLEKALKESGKPAEFGYHSALAARQDVRKWVQIDLGKLTSLDKIELVPAHDDYAGIGAGFGFPPSFRVEISDDAEFSTATLVAEEVDLENPRSSIVAYELDRQPVRYVRITATKLFLRQDAFIFALGELRVFDEDANVAQNAKVEALDSIEAAPRWRRANLVDGLYAASSLESLQDRLQEHREERKALLKRVVPVSLRQSQTALLRELQQVQVALDGLPAQGKVYAGTIHHGSDAFRGTGPNGGKPRTVHVLHRGDILKPRAEAFPGTIPLAPDDSGLFTLADGHAEGTRRVTLADWIVSPDNPLTWRSVVNRIWQYHFGSGLVATPNDLGRMGSEPSHPELLDRLAVEFRDSGQSWKALHRLIVTSAAYRRSSEHVEAHAAIDKDNRYLWRMNRRRLSAEEIRDAVLMVSGELNREMYGPGVKLFDLERPEHSPHYEYHKHDPSDPASHRRSIYRFIVRSQPDPFMTTLDCADSSQSVGTRTETVTPLQALSLLNNKFMLAMSGSFAQRVRLTASTPREYVREAFQRALGRTPTLQEYEALLAYQEAHGLENLCRLLFNLNEFVFVD